MAAAAHSPSDPTAVATRRATPSERDEVLAVLLTGKARAWDPAVGRFVSYARSQGLSLDHLWLAERAGQLLGATLLIPNPGRTAMIFLSPLTALDVAGAARLVAEACRALDRRRVQLVQALLEPGETIERRALQQAGFDDLAHLTYMQRAVSEADDGPAQLTLESPVEAAVWSESARGLFQRAVLASYEQTRDCPRLVGLREVDDIIAGHQAVGSFDPRHWLALHAGGEPVGVMLINALPQRESMELVYLGLAPRWRGRGLARRLLAHGLTLTRRAGGREMLLAVDQANAPAMKLYRDTGFTAQAYKHAMIRPTE
jgi:ribosomal protein S18 acetylase RimI-like enzyme